MNIAPGHPGWPSSGAEGNIAMNRTSIRIGAALLLAGTLLFSIVITLQSSSERKPHSTAPANAVIVRTSDVPQSAEPTEPAEQQPAADWRLLLVNRSHPLPEGFSVDLVTLANGRSVDARIYPDLQEMFDAMRAEGIIPMVNEGYRTNEEQRAIMQSRVDAYLLEGYPEDEAETLAEAWVARPGTSEHEAGLALDICADKITDTANETVYLWLAEHAHQYGFILRYPEGGEEITGIAYEPWHYRYVGRETAAEIHRRQITLEEYLGSS